MSRIAHIGINRKMVSRNTHHCVMSKVSKQIGKEVTKSAETKESKNILISIALP